MSEDENDYLSYYDPESRKRLRLKYIKHIENVNNQFWQGTGMAFDENYEILRGSIPDTSILTAAIGTNFYVDENYTQSPAVAKFVHQLTEESSEPVTIRAFNKLNEVQSDVSSGKFERAKELTKNLQREFENNNCTIGVKRTNELLRLLENDIIEIKERIKKNKIEIHKLIYNKKLNRCLLHKELSATCAKLDEIKQKIESPEIFGFFMYQFPKKQSNIKIKLPFSRTNKYIKEINQIKALIIKINENPLVKIELPTEVTDLDIKTCDFCRIARSFDFGILLLSPINPNAYLEAGMFLSLGKKVILLNNQSVLKKAPFDLEPFFYIPYENLGEIEKNWNKKIPNFIEDLIKEYTREIPYDSHYA